MILVFTTIVILDNVILDHVILDGDGIRHRSHPIKISINLFIHRSKASPAGHIRTLSSFFCLFLCFSLSRTYVGNKTKRTQNQLTELVLS